MGDEDIIPAAEIKRHNSKGDLWLTIHGNVYDVSDFMTEHPGGEDALLSQAELDATDAFEDVGHSRDARALLETFKKGKSDKMERDTRMAAAAFTRLEESSASYTWVYVGAVACLMIIVRLTWN